MRPTETARETQQSPSRDQPGVQQSPTHVPVRPKISNVRTVGPPRSSLLISRNIRTR